MIGSQLISRFWAKLGEGWRSLIFDSTDRRTSFSRINETPTVEGYMPNPGLYSTFLGSIGLLLAIIYSSLRGSIWFWAITDNAILQYSIPSFYMTFRIHTVYRSFDMESTTSSLTKCKGTDWAIFERLLTSILCGHQKGSGQKPSVSPTKQEPRRQRWVATPNH